MSPLSVTVKCETPKCKEHIAKYGENYHRVYDIPPERKRPVFMPDAIAMCESCGGYTNGKEWKHTCEICGKDVAPGELMGFFAPHRCKECDEKIVAREKASGKICSRCRQVYSYCCC